PRGGAAQRDLVRAGKITGRKFTGLQNRQNVDTGVPTDRMKMHEGEVDINRTVVQRLIAEQFPKLAHLPLREVQSTGTVNAIYRLGDDLCVRLPRMEQGRVSLEKEWTWLPHLAPHLSVRVPRPVAMGEPMDCFPFRWAIYQWIDGAPYADGLVEDECDAARELEIGRAHV